MARIKFGKKAKKVGDKAETPAPSVPLWMQTYGDFMTLLLTFFVLLLATMSESTSDSTVELIATAFQGAFGVMPGGATLSESNLIYGGASANTLPSDQRGYSTADSVDKASSKLRDEIESKKIRISEDERGFVITLGADQYFRSASAEIAENQETTETFIKLAALLSQVPNDIRIEGHTDGGRFIAGSAAEKEFGNNWGLSTARAIAVLERLFVEDQTRDLNRDKFSVSGFAETKPIASNDMPDGRALNRRVDIILVRQDVTYYNQK